MFCFFCQELSLKKYEKSNFIGFALLSVGLQFVIAPF